MSDDVTVPADMPPAPVGPSAKIIADSISPNGVRLTSVELRIHRFILAELNTHRKFSRNSASSRAIPIDKTLARLQNTDGRAMPLVWPCEQAGMSGGNELADADLFEARDVLTDIAAYTWTRIREYVTAHPDKTTRLHKSILNRPLEWFSWHTVLVTSTEWDNFFRQRCSPSAQPEFRVVAEQIQSLLATNEPAPVAFGDWHLPYIADDDRGSLAVSELLKVSAGRCARVSYMTHDGVRDPSEDIRLFDETLAKYGHWSPLEHQGSPRKYERYCANFDAPWVQHRWYVENGYVT